MFRHFTPEYKDQAVRLVLNSGRTTAEVAKTIGPVAADGREERLAVVSDLCEALPEEIGGEAWERDDPEGGLTLAVVADEAAALHPRHVAGDGDHRDAHRAVWPAD